ncbi:MAG TPA: ribosome maturation factor RimP [Desulfobacteraceae bacterium]|nr:ribosome maturation factor RimP [Desulfobacteraceae bacterium]
MSVAEKIIGQVTVLVEPVIEELGFELVDVDFLTDRGRRVLRLYVDRECGGITLDECVEVSREVDGLIELEDVVPDPYVLEVSSPGLDRPLRKEKHFAAAVGRKVKVKMKKPVENRRNFTGMLESFNANLITLQIENHNVTLPVAEIEKARIVYEV